MVHLVFLHETGSRNPLGVSSDVDKLPLHPAFLAKDFLGVTLILLGLLRVVSYAP